MRENWHPTATIDTLRIRAALFKKIRSFFEERNILEVETPLIGSSTATDPYLMSFETELLQNGKKHQRFLQTSPEFPMKRLLAAGSGSIFQLCKAFRNGEASHKHNPEFTILEWYRVGFTHVEMMTEVGDFLTFILDTPPPDKISYHDLFNGYFTLDPHSCSVKELRQVAEHYQIGFEEKSESNRDIWLDLLLTHIIEPELGFKNPIIIYDYPSSQASLARMRKENNYSVGERFELYYKGIELANGYHELGNPDEQLQRFVQDNLVRKQLRYRQIPVDEYLITSLSALPDCAGVALGVDRLICLAVNSTNIQDVMTFPSHLS